MRIGAFEIKEPLPELKEPHVLATLQPWINVGNVGNLTLSWLETRFEAQKLGKLFRPGNFFDFTRYRPTSHYKEGQRKLIIPNTRITYIQQKTDNDFLFLHILEPHNQSEVYVESILKILKTFGVKRYGLIGSMYDYVPHTKPLLVTGGTMGTVVEREFKQMGIKSSKYQGPTSIATLISQQATAMDIETMSLLVHLPQYTQLDDDYIGAVKLIEILSSMYGFPEDEDYIKKAEQQQEQITLALERNPQLKTTIEELETRYEARANRNKGEETPKLSPEVESFLTEMEKRLTEE
ncbi:PAC2 family protein [Chloroflexota bacterium]